MTCWHNAAYNIIIIINKTLYISEQVLPLTIYVTVCNGISFVNLDVKMVNYVPCIDRMLGFDQPMGLSI